MDAALLIAFIAPALFHLGARAKITQPIHSRYPAWLVGFMNCAACAGAWYAAAAAVVFIAAGWRVFGMTSWWAIPVALLFGNVWVPFAADKQETALQNLSAPEYAELPPMQIDLTPLRNSVLTLAARAEMGSRQVEDAGAKAAFDALAADAVEIAHSM